MARMAHKHIIMKHTLHTLLLLLAGVVTLYAAPLDETFANLPDESKP